MSALDEALDATRRRDAARAEAFEAAAARDPSFTAARDAGRRDVGASLQATVAAFVLVL